MLPSFSGAFTLNDRFSGVSLDSSFVSSFIITEQNKNFLRKKIKVQLLICFFFLGGIIFGFLLFFCLFLFIIIADKFF